jgi:hypothetical protein
MRLLMVDLYVISETGEPHGDRVNCFQRIDDSIAPHFDVDARPSYPVVLTSA